VRDRRSDPANGSGRRRGTDAPANRLLRASGMTELAVGALLGWPYSLAVSSPTKAARLGVRSADRLRQAHLDFVLMGALSVLDSFAVPGVPGQVAGLAVAGTWLNPGVFLVLAARPNAAERAGFRAAIGGSFAAATAARVAAAVIVCRRSATLATIGR